MCVCPKLCSSSRGTDSSRYKNLIYRTNTSLTGPLTTVHPSLSVCLFFHLLSVVCLHVSHCLCLFYVCLFCMYVSFSVDDCLSLCECVCISFSPPFPPPISSSLSLSLPLLYPIPVSFSFSLPLIMKGNINLSGEIYVQYNNSNAFPFVSHATTYSWKALHSPPRGPVTIFKARPA